MAAVSRGKTAPENVDIRKAPGVHLRAELRRLGLDQIAVSKATGVSRQSVNNIINGRQPISRAMAGKLGRLTGHSSDYWLSDGFSERGSEPYTGVSGLLVNHQIVRAVQDGIIGIKPFAVGQIRMASIELTLGERIAVDGEEIALSKRKTLTLKPGGTLSAETAESIELPLDYLGRLGGLTSIIAAGLMIAAPLQIEPGHIGTLAFGLFNAGPAPVTLQAGEPVVTLEIVRLGVGAER